MNILIVDDDNSTVKLFEYYLLQFHYSNFESFTDSSKAIASYSLKEYDIIITDLQMPQIDGIAFLQKINEINIELKKKQPYIIVVTGSIVESLKQKCMEQGCNEFLVKPVRINNFINAVRNHSKI
ncbi:response regulator [Candidatus Uabimicrobium sp. HlEnr_7]|uniref:response regulator n=1 Tax=Candidatus Uabimicrobium helgolandensis TaxID=3095367 RepID=UPI00355688BF